MGTRTENERVTLRERIFHCLILLQVPNQRRMWREHRRSPSTRVTHRPRCVWRMCRPTGSQSVLQTTRYGLTRSASLTGFVPCLPAPKPSQGNRDHARCPNCLPFSQKFWTLQVSICQRESLVGQWREKKKKLKKRWRGNKEIKETQQRLLHAFYSVLIVCH